ncbi:arginine utilization regulatory protein RocR [Bacillus halotolerans]|uniref:arginine utilization regulatory protein RocR n=1 Tax=Bacillus halotolerans TaxID=260554 RepID=UPI0024C19537|nr:arginine utilization regulatory protein RocR [Bacillus halotolerans]MEC3637384.1 arginine utilization regulatory protein RocR [Bacillus halotolerans]WHY24483.1 arginine utilization regulatory protein RocR [Bacillus halotolerans]
MVKDSEFLTLVFQSILDEIDVGLHVVDEHGNTIVYNNKMMQIEDMEKQDVLNKNLMDVFMFSKQQDSTLVQALQEGKTIKNVKQSYFNNKGQEITTINHTYPIVQDGNIKGAVEIAKDVTKLERLIRENMHKKGNATYTFDSILGTSPAIQDVIENAKRATRTSSSVLLAGETGTGKELFAQSIHNGSDRSSGPFISQNCAALPDSLVESILFGTKKGAFTGAVDQPGLFEQAHGGTLLLDEINSLNLSLQAKLLRALQERKIRRIGSTKDTPIDVRIIATMNEDPIDAIAGERMRKDLYYRLSVVTLIIPPLRERKEDILLLASEFIQKNNHLFQMAVEHISEDVKQFFLSYDWPGNIRELEHMIEGAMNFMTDEQTITANHLPYQYRMKIKPADISKPEPAGHQPAADLKEKMESFEKYVIENILRKHGHNISKTAQELGISRQSLQYRLKKFSLHAK